MKSNHRRAFSLLLLPLLVLSSLVFADGTDTTICPARAAPRIEISSPAGSERWISGARVRDISDRAYQGAVIDLLVNARSSIVLSLYMLKADTAGPVRLLVKDLEDALDRGVAVEIYLNMRPDHGMVPSDITDEPFRSLTAKGARIYRFTPHVRLHDKLIIVDSRYVVDGSMNWSVSAIKSNYESAVLIDAPELAKAKLMRLRNFPLEGSGNPDEARPDRPRSLAALPADAVVNLPMALVSDGSYLPWMVRRQASRAMDACLLLFAESARTGEKGFFMPLEDLAVTLGMDPVSGDTALRRQMIKVLESLADDYKLMDVNFTYGKDAWIDLKDLPGGTFTVGGDLFGARNLASMSQPAKFVILLVGFLASEGKSVDSFSAAGLARRFGVSEFSIRKGMREIGLSK